jgi:hypothetical protein
MYAASMVTGNMAIINRGVRDHVDRMAGAARERRPHRLLSCHTKNQTGAEAPRGQREALSQNHPQDFPLGGADCLPDTDLSCPPLLEVKSKSA